MIKVLITDDQLILKEGIKYILEHDSEISVVGFAENGKDALDMCDRHLPDVVLMDIVMPGVDGVEGTRLIKEKHSQIKVIILTTFNDDENITRALQNGADGYMLKDSKPEELILAIKAATKGIRIIHKNTLPSIVKRINSGSKISIMKKDNSSVKLTERELDIIRLVVEGKDNKEIAGELFISEGSARNAISRLLKKLELRDRIQLAVYAVKNDLVT